MASSAAAAGNGTGGILPTHTAAPSAPAWPSKTKDPRRRRRCLCVCLLVTLAVLVALAITLLVLFLTVLKVRDPTTRLVSTHLAGVAPRLTFPALSVQLNVTLLLTVAVHNPNPASFAYDTDLLYRGKHDPGRIPSRGDGLVSLALTLQADGSLALQANTVIFGFIKRHAVAYSDCSFVFGVAEMAVRSQQCHDRTKL